MLCRLINSLFLALALISCGPIRDAALNATGQEDREIKIGQLISRGADGIDPDLRNAVTPFSDAWIFISGQESKKFTIGGGYTPVIRVLSVVASA